MVHPTAAGTFTSHPPARVIFGNRAQKNRLGSELLPGEAFSLVVRRPPASEPEKYHGDDRD